MKKIFLLLIIIAPTIYFLYSTKDTSVTPFSKSPTRAWPSSIREMILHPTKSYEDIAAAKSPVSTLPYKFDDMESLEHLERDFADLPDSKIEEMINKSNKLIDSMNLIEKANKGNLSQEDANTIVREMRIQTAARKVLIDRLLEKKAEKS